MKKIIAKIKFEKGPAKETMASSRSLFLKLFLLTGTGFAQPIKAKPEANDANGIITVPIRSTCFIGLNVSLPSFRAVSSPNWDAENACANS